MQLSQSQWLAVALIMGLGSWSMFVLSLSLLLPTRKPVTRPVVVAYQPPAEVALQAVP